MLTVRFRDTTSAAFLGIALSRLVLFIVDLFLLIDSPQIGVSRSVDGPSPQLVRLHGERNCLYRPDRGVCQVTRGGEDHNTGGRYDGYSPELAIGGEFNLLGILHEIWVYVTPVAHVLSDMHDL